MRKIDLNKINLQIDNIEFADENAIHSGYMRVYWSSDIGFGEFNMLKSKKGELLAYTEHMDADSGQR
jgi:hypothetical protein